MDIKAVVKSRGWTISQVAENMTNKAGGKGITQSSLSQIINGNPTLDKLREVAGIIGVSVSELVADDPAGVPLVCPRCGARLCADITLRLRDGDTMPKSRTV